MLPLIAGSVGIVINFGLAYFITRVTDMGAAGVALAYSISSVFIAATLLLLFNKRLKGFKFISSPGFIIKTIGAVIIMGFVVLISDRLAMPALFRKSIFEISKLNQAFWIMLDVTAGIIVYGFVSYSLKIDEMRQITHGILGKLKSIVNN